MKAFTIAFSVVTVSTILAVLLLTVSLQDVQQAISKTIPKRAKALLLYKLAPTKAVGKRGFSRLRRATNLEIPPLSHGALSH
jgi:hypothetical protein